MSERSKETVLKTVEGQPSASSNLALSATKGFRQLPETLFSCRNACNSKGFGVSSLVCLIMRDRSNTLSMWGGWWGDNFRVESRPLTLGRFRLCQGRRSAMHSAVSRLAITHMEWCIKPAIRPLLRCSLNMTNLRDLPTYTYCHKGFSRLHMQPTRPTSRMPVGRVGCTCRLRNHNDSKV